MAKLAASGSLMRITLSAAMGALASAAAYLLSALFSGVLGVNLAVAAAVFLVVSFNLNRSYARTRLFPHPRCWAGLASGLSLLIIAVSLALPHVFEALSAGTAPLSSTSIQLLAERAIPLKTFQPGSGFEDLQPLKTILEGKRIVALGEATHGTSEFFKMKHRLLEFLVLEMGFEHFGMEIGPQPAQVIEDYIRGGASEPQTVLYWPWATQELLAMLDWMRAYNTLPSTARQLHFHGIDPGKGERDRTMAENTAQILEQYGPHSKIVLWAHNAHISKKEGQLGFYLKQRFGDLAYLLGFEFSKGAFTSRMQTVHIYSVRPAPPSYYAHTITSLGEPVLFLDFQTISREPELQAWLGADQRSHNFQELHAVFRLIPVWHYQSKNWLDLYDGVIYIEESTPAAGLH